MKAYIFSDDDLDDEELFFIMSKLFASRLNKSALPKKHFPQRITDDDIVKLAKHLNLSVNSLRKIMNDNLKTD